MLTAYENAVKQLIQPVWSGLIPTATLDQYINTARAQLAADAECIRFTAPLTMTAGEAQYSFSAIDTSAQPNVKGVIAVRAASIAGEPMEFRPWEWFEAYYYGRGGTLGTPSVYAVQQESFGGAFYVWPTPNSAAVSTPINFDVVALPIDLVSDSTTEIIPPLWTDAVPFYAAWLAMMQVQRQTDAHLMLARYQQLARRGRQVATPSELPGNYQGGQGAQLAGAKTTLAPAAPQQGGG